MVFVSKISYFCVLPACVFFKVLYTYKFIRARVLYAQNLYARAYFAYLLVYSGYYLEIGLGLCVRAAEPGKTGFWVVFEGYRLDARLSVHSNDTTRLMRSARPTTFVVSMLCAGIGTDTGISSDAESTEDMRFL
jgi:hypothetical protein